MNQISKDLLDEAVDLLMKIQESMSLLGTGFDDEIKEFLMVNEEVKELNYGEEKEVLKSKGLLAQINCEIDDEQ